MRVMNDSQREVFDVNDAPTSDTATEMHCGTREDQDLPREIGGRKGPDPVRYGDWEKNGRCIDF